MANEIFDEVATRDYMIDISHMENRDTILDLFENASFKHMIQNKILLVKLKMELETNEKRVVAKKKKSATPYIINSFIFYTSFMSKAEIKLKKDSKSWQIMGAVDAVSKTPIDCDGYEFRKMVEELEAFHKDLVVYDKDKKVDKELTTALRKSVISYAQNLLTAYYKNEEVAPPTDENDNVYLSACKKLYERRDDYKSKVERFKTFLKRHDMIKEEEGGEKRKNRGDAVAAVSKKRFTADMISDELDNTAFAIKMNH